MHKKIAAFVLLIALFAALSSCGVGSSAPPSPQKTPTLAELTAALDAHFNVDGLHVLDEGRTLDNLGLTDDALAAYAMKVPIGTNMDEYGVFIAAPGHEAEVQKAVAAYMAMRLEAWRSMGNYTPEEDPKISEAESRTSGAYVVYVMAFKDTRNAFMKTFESLVR